MPVCPLPATAVSFTPLRVMGDPVPPTLLDDVYNRDALAGRPCPQPLPSLDVRRGRRHLPAVLRFGVCRPTAHPLTLLQ